MKLKYILTPVLVGVGLVAMTSCSDDNDSNPTLHMPESFTLNTPATAESVLDLEATTDDVVLTWSQPNYGGFPVAATYYVQYSVDKDFSTLVDDDGSTADYYIQADEPLTTCTASISVSDLNRNLVNMLGATSAEELPAVLDVYFRITAQTASTDVIYSNVVSIKTAPYYQSMVAADPVLWYLTGSCIGNGSWSNDVPAGCMPMYFSQNSTYDYATGAGEIVWIGYLTSDGFKFRGSPDDNWAVQIGQGDSFGEYKLNDGGSGNITVPAAGIYQVVLDTKLNEPTITAYEGSVHDFTDVGIALSGSFNGWGNTAMEAVTTYGGENHDWHLTIDFTAGTEVKFKQGDDSWSFNWGGSLTNLSYGYYGTGLTNGDNLYIDEDGTYDVYFNDITGNYRFVRQ